MSTATPTAAVPKRPRWIVSAGWDLSYIVITPLLIVPVVLILARRWMTAEEISLAAIAFGSLGHHLPGFMRAYGDHDLFARYRLRFLLVPLLVFGIALLFSPPAALASALRLPWTHLHGLELILLAWGTWHGLMQTYGFMRIYDVRMGVNDHLTAWLDHLLCLSVFAAGIAFSDSRMFGVADAMWQSGLPLFGPEWVDRTRTVIGGAGLCVLVAYAINQVRLRRQGIPISWIKLLLIGTTGWFYWFTGRLSTNLLIGLAMFEIYHAIQYDAIVWIYNRKLFQRAGDRFGPLGFLFRDRWTMLGIYLVAIGAYSSIRYFSVDANAYVFRGGSEDAHQWLVAMFVTSSFLHFYFDGFIWKVSEKKTQQNLVDEITHTSVAERYVPAFVHASKWGLLLAIIGGLLGAEYYQGSRHGDRTIARLQALANLTPNLPESQSLLSRQALAQGNTTEAITHAQQALALRPRSHAMLADLALAYMQAGELEQAEQKLDEAIRLAPEHQDYQCDLSILLVKQGKQEEAMQLAHSLVANNPNNWLAQLALGSVLNANGQGEAALPSLEIARGLRPQSPDVHYQLGLAQFQRGQTAKAIPPLLEATELAPQHFDAQFQLANTFYTLGKLDQALDAYARCQELQPQHAGLCANLGGLLAQQGRSVTAEHVYRAGLAAHADSAQLHYNLGVLLWQQGDQDAARELFQQAEALGMNLPANVREATQEK